MYEKGSFRRYRHELRGLLCARGEERREAAGDKRGFRKFIEEQHDRRIRRGRADLGGDRRGGREGRVRRFAARGEGERRAEGEGRAVARGYSETGIREDMAAAYGLCRIRSAAFLYFDGAHDGLAASRVFPRDGERDDFRADSVPADRPHRVHQFQVLPRRLYVARARRAEYGFAYRSRLERGSRLRRVRAL